MVSTKSFSKPNREKIVKRFTIELSKNEIEMLNKLCKIHHRKYNEEIMIMIKFYYTNHLWVEKYHQ